MNTQVQYRLIKRSLRRTELKGFDDFVERIYYYGSEHPPEVIELCSLEELREATLKITSKGGSWHHCDVVGFKTEDEQWIYTIEERVITQNHYPDGTVEIVNDEFRDVNRYSRSHILDLWD